MKYIYFFLNRDNGQKKWDNRYFYIFVDLTENKNNKKVNNFTKSEIFQHIRYEYIDYKSRENSTETGLLLTLYLVLVLSFRFSKKKLSWVTEFVQHYR